MSTIIMSACWALQGMSPAQKSVLISLADNANDEGVCWPSVRKISVRTCLSERAVQGAIRWLVDARLLSISERAGRSTMYTVTPAAYAPPQEMRPADAAPQPPQMPHPTPADAAPRTVIEPSDEPPIETTEVLEVFDHWRVTMLSPRSKLDDKRRRLIKAALKHYSVADLKQAIDGCKASPFHMGDNDRREKYNGLDLILRNSEKIEGFMAKAERPPVAVKQSAITQDFQSKHYEGTPNEQLADFLQ